MAVKINGRIATIYLNSEFIKIAEVSKSVKTVTVHKTVTVPMPSGCYAEGDITDIKNLGKVIKLALDENRITCNNVAFTVASNKIATKDVLVPDVKAAKLDKIIETNASEYFPVNIDDYVVQYYTLDKVNDNEQDKLKTVVIAAPSQFIEKYYKLAETIGFKVAFIDYAGNSTYQIMRQQIGAEVSLVVDIENDSTIINIFKENTLQLQRIIPYGKSLLVNAVMEQYGLKYDIALSRLQSEELLGSTLDSNELSESLRALVSNINRITDYYVSRNNVPIEKAYIIGNATKIVGFNQLLSNEFNIEINAIEQLAGVMLDKRTYVNGLDLTSYITNIGALIAPVNFISKERIAQEKKKDSNRSLILVGSVALAASALLVAVPGIQCLISGIGVSSLKSSVNKLSDVEDIVDEYYEAKDEYIDISLFKALTTNNNDSLDAFISNLEQKTPSDVVITSMSVSSGVVAISGTATSKSSLGKYIQQLNSIKSVTNVKVANETESKDNTGTIKVTFSLSCSFGQIEESK